MNINKTFKKTEVEIRKEIIESLIENIDLLTKAFDQIKTRIKTEGQNIVISQDDYKWLMRRVEIAIADKKEQLEEHLKKQNN